MSFFTFLNRKATLGIDFWGYLPGQGRRQQIPIEEIAFYSLGFLAVLLAYIWGDEIWCGAYNINDGPRREVRGRVFSFHPHSAAAGVVLLDWASSTRSGGRIPGTKGFRGISFS